MTSIEPCPLPTASLLQIYAKNGDYTDCFRTEIDARVSHAQYVNAFYTTAVFKLERVILKWLVSKPSHDAQARQLADGLIDEFAAWRVENRSTNQLLMCDYQGRTRSWLMVIPVEEGETGNTELYFGSAITRLPDAKTGGSKLGRGFSMLLGFHKIYSRLLLSAARSRLAAQLSRRSDLS